MVGWGARGAELLGRQCYGKCESWQATWKPLGRCIEKHDRRISTRKNANAGARVASIQDSWLFFPRLLRYVETLLLSNLRAMMRARC